MRFFKIIIIFVFFLIFFFLQKEIDKQRKVSLREILLQELMYFPSGKFLKEMAIEYDNLLSDFVWLRAIQYYGFHLVTDRKYDYLFHIFDILTTLDERFSGAYHFASFCLAWDAQKPDSAIYLLKRALIADPFNWQHYFDIGFINYMIIKNYEEAGYYFYLAAQLPQTWRISERWAAFSYGKSPKKEFAEILWQDIYNSTDNPQLKKIAKRGLKVLKREKDLEYLQKAVDKFIKEKKKVPVSLLELYKEGYIDSIPKEPFGYFYKIKNGKVIYTKK
uniref:Tetratricopeptide repeat protein n=1 Tax=candidate division WOR-3 bacterium TaxID=2052148 RepID=A0A7V4E315_UNCW3